MSELDKCRKAFEARQCKDKDFAPNSEFLDKSETGIYYDSSVDAEWDAWQAAWNSRSTDGLMDEMAEEIKRLREVLWGLELDSRVPMDIRAFIATFCTRTCPILTKHQACKEG